MYVGIGLDFFEFFLGLDLHQPVKISVQDLRMFLKFLDFVKNFFVVLGDQSDVG